MSRSHREQPEPDTLSRRGGPPALVRSARVVPRGSPRWLLLHLLRETRDPAWSPLAAARRLIGYADSDLDLLRTARARLVQAAPPGARSNGSHARALATLNIAIADLNETPETKPKPGEGAGGVSPR